MIVRNDMVWLECRLLCDPQPMNAVSRFYPDNSHSTRTFAVTTHQNHTLQSGRWAILQYSQSVPPLTSRGTIWKSVCLLEPCPGLVQTQQATANCHFQTETD